MYIDYISDIHGDFHIPFNKNQIKWKQRTERFVGNLMSNSIIHNDILIIAGDLSHYNIQSKWIVDRLAEYYLKVLVVYGNHDYYLISNNQKSKYRNSENRIQELKSMLEQNSKVKVLDNELYKYKNLKFYGSTMWYPLETIEQKVFFMNMSNDSRLIHGTNIQNKHEEQLKKYYDVVKDVDVMISHVPLININSHFKYNSTTCYLTPVKQLAPYTVFGHSHEQNKYIRAGYKCYINALGYPDEMLDLKIKSFEVIK